MVSSYVTGISMLAGLVVLWVAVQAACRGVFPDVADSGDALERRSGCGACAGAPSCSTSGDCEAANEVIR